MNVLILVYNFMDNFNDKTMNSKNIFFLLSLVWLPILLFCYIGTVFRNFLGNNQGICEL